MAARIVSLHDGTGNADLIYDYLAPAIEFAVAIGIMVDPFRDGEVDNDFVRCDKAANLIKAVSLTVGLGR